jgi:hypothetical protein
MRRFLLAVLCLFSVSAYARGFSPTQDFRPATPEELAMKSVPGHEGAEAAILDLVRIDDDQNSTSSEYVRMKIFTEAGKKHSDIELVYVPMYPFNGRIDDISARTIRPDGSTVPFDGKVYDKVVYKVGRNAVKAKTFSLTDVQPGSIIEYRYTRRWTPHLLLDTTWGVQRDIPIVRAKFILTPYDSKGEYGSFFTYAGLPAGVMPKKNGKTFELELTNMPALRTERFMPPEDQVRAKVNFVYTSSTVKPDKFWEFQAPAFAKEIDKFLNAKEAKAEAAKLVAGVADPRAQLEKIYAHVQSFRNYSFEADKTEQEVKRESIDEARNAGEVLRKKAGFTHELNRAFVALARAAGFDADAMRVAPRDEVFFTDKLPDADQMSGEIAMVTLDGKPLYLDPGTPGAPFGLVSWEKSNVPSIQAAKGGKHVWGSVPGYPADEAVTRRKADLKMNGDVLEGTVAITYVGQEALVQRLTKRESDEAARKKSFEDDVKRLFPEGAEVKLKQLTGFEGNSRELTATFDVTLPNFVATAGSRTVLPLSVFASTATNPFAPTTRTHLIYFPYPSKEEDEIKVTLPEGLTGAMPQPANIDAGIMKYAATAKREANVVTFTRNVTYGANLVDPKHYPALRQFFSNVTTADQQPLVLAKGGGK